MIGVRTVVNKKVLSLIFFTAAIFGGMRYALTPNRVVVFCDQKLPAEIQEQVIQYLQAAPVRSLGAQQLCKELQEKYPSIQALSLTYKGSLVAYGTVQARVPWVYFISTLPGNTEYVMCKDGQVLEKKYFNESVTTGMASMIIEGNDYQSNISDEALIKCARELERSLFDEYTITWRSKVEILLQSRHSNSILVADRMTIHDNERLEHVKRIISSDTERYKDGIRADLRLKDEIVCAPLAGKST